MGQSSSSTSSSIKNSRSPDWSDFNSSGPKQLTRIDWENRAHQRVVASTLVNALYVMLDDSTTGSDADNRRAPQWWSSFGFQLDKPLVDSNDRSPSTPCFGAVFKRSTDSTSGPHLVFAIRGLKTPRDCDVILTSWLSNLDSRTCFKVLMEALERHTSDESLRGKIWLCGHSLGAAIATGAGQEMARRGIYLTTFLFNPPYNLDPTTKNLFFVDLGKAMKELAKAASAGGLPEFLEAGISLAIYHSEKETMEHIVREKKAEVLYPKMRSWVPFIFVNQGDYICQEYIKYFENRERKDPPHLPDRIASAVLVRNVDERASTFPESHGLMQWWIEDLDVQAKECRVENEPRILEDGRY